MKFAVFCPRFFKEAEESWQARWSACRRYMREHPEVNVIQFDSFEELTGKFGDQFRRIIVAQLGYYSAEFQQWAARNRVSTLDVMNRAA